MEKNKNATEKVFVVRSSVRDPLNVMMLFFWLQTKHMAFKTREQGQSTTQSTDHASENYICFAEKSF